MKDDVRFVNFPSKMFDFDSIPLLRFTLVINLKKIDFESHWNILIFFDKKIYMTSKLNMTRWKMTDFVSFPLFGITLIIALRHFDFESHWYLNFLTKWNDVEKYEFYILFK